MKLRQTRLFALAVSAVMVLGTVACGGGAATGGNAASNANNSTDSSSGGATAATTDSSGDSGGDTAAAPADLLQVEMFNTYANYMGVQPGWFGKMLVDKFNIELNIIAPNVAGGGDTLYQTRSAAGNLGDIIVTNKARMKECQETGLLMDITELLKSAPNLQKLQAGIDNCKEFIGADGIYAIPGRFAFKDATEAIGRGLNPESATFLRWDWYEEIGAPEIDGFDGLLDVMKQIIALHPTSASGAKVYGFIGWPDWDGPNVRMVSEFMHNYGYNGVQGTYWTDYTGKDAFSITDEGGLYYQMLKKFNQAYREGLVDPDSSTQNYDLAQAKVKDGAILFNWHAWMPGTIHDRFDMETSVPYALVPIKGSTIPATGNNPYGNEGNAYALGSGAKQPERLMEMLDWFASDEGALIWNNHIEGLTYEMVDGRAVLTDFGKNWNGQELPAPAEMGGGKFKEGTQQINYPLIHSDDVNGILGEPANSNLWKSTIDANSNIYNQKWTEIYKASDPLTYLKNNNMLAVTPGFDYTTPPDPSDISTIRAQIKTLFNAAGYKMVYAATDDEFQSIWDQVINELPGFGLEELLEYDRKIVEDRAAAIAKVLK